MLLELLKDKSLILMYKSLVSYLSKKDGLLIIYILILRETDIQLKVLSIKHDHRLINQIYYIYKVLFNKVLLNLALSFYISYL